MLTSFSYLFNASTDDVLNVLELCSQKGFSKLFSHECSGLWVSALCTAILGISTAQEEVALPTPPALQAPGVAIFLAPALTCLPLQGQSLCSQALTLCQRLFFTLCLSFLQRSPFPILLASLQKERWSHLFRNCPSVSAWLIVHLHLNCSINLNWLNWFSKLKNKNRGLNKNHRSKLSLKWLSLSSSRAQDIPE